MTHCEWKKRTVIKKTVIKKQVTELFYCKKGLHFVLKLYTDLHKWLFRLDLASRWQRAMLSDKYGDSFKPSTRMSLQRRASPSLTTAHKHVIEKERGETVCEFGHVQVFDHEEHACWLRAKWGWRRWQDETRESSAKTNAAKSDERALTKLAAINLITRRWQNYDTDLSTTQAAIWWCVLETECYWETRSFIDKKFPKSESGQMH